MDTSSRFFAKLRSLAVLLNTERANLEQIASQNVDKDEDDLESRAVQALHELHSEVRGFKRQVKSQVASQEDGSYELRSFIKSCMVLKQRTTEDIERIQRHFEKYGYKPQKASLKSDVNGQCEADTKPCLDDEPERDPAAEKEGDKGEEVEAQQCETPKRMPPPAVDQMRTPQLADFGLSALHLQMVLGNTEPSRELVPPPALALTPPLLVMSMQEFQPKTPRCSLVMDEDAPTPRLEDFGITENTMCLNNDFTMDLFRKKPPKVRQTHSALVTDQNPADDLPTPPAPGRLSSDSMESPEVPVFSTLELNVNKHLGPSAVPNGMSDELQSPPRPSKAPGTPELPAFETPYISKLISARKETKPIEKKDLAGSLNNISNTSDSPAATVPSSDVSQISSTLSQNDDATPEMPRLQSHFGSSLPCIGGGNRSGLLEPSGPVLHADEEHTQDWYLATPRVRMDFGVEPRTPEMPDMSSITQDIFKLVSQANNKQINTASGQQNSKACVQTLAPGKENRVQCVAQVSEKEFHGLASFMKQIPLTNLNLAIKKINHIIEERHRDGEHSEEFHMEELRKVLDVGPQTPIYVYCLVELKRLKNVQGVGRNATFKVLTNV